MSYRSRRSSSRCCRAHASPSHFGTRRAADLRGFLDESCGGAALEKIIHDMVEFGYGILAGKSDAAGGSPNRLAACQRLAAALSPPMIRHRVRRCVDQFDDFVMTIAFRYRTSRRIRLRPRRQQGVLLQQQLNHVEMTAFASQQQRRGTIRLLSVDICPMRIAERHDAK